MCHESPAPTEAPQQTPVSDTQRPRSYLFMVRVWPEDLGDGKTEWRGQVRHVMSGEVRYFREWSNLIAILQEMLTTPEEAAEGVWKQIGLDHITGRQ